MKYTENNIPSHLKLQVIHLHPGKVSKNQLKRIGQTNAKYVTIARLWEKDDREGEMFLAAEGIAACSPKDNPSRKIGRHVAIGRALRTYEEEFLPIDRIEEYGSGTPRGWDYAEA